MAVCNQSRRALNSYTDPQHERGASDGTPSQRRSTWRRGILLSMSWLQRCRRASPLPEWDQRNGCKQIIQLPQNR